MQTYKTIKGTATAQIEEKKSRFIANISFADTEEAALRFLAKIRTENPSANHNVYAYVLGDGTVRCSDDKEPSKTAGAPVLNVLQSACISDAIIVVTRYFGGTLLGTGGLIRAYEKSAKAALEKAEISLQRQCVQLSFLTEYAMLENISKKVTAANAKLLETEFGEKVKINLLCLCEETEKIKQVINEITCGSVKIEISESFFKEF